MKIVMASNITVNNPLVMTIRSLVTGHKYTHYKHLTAEDGERVITTILENTVRIGQHHPGDPPMGEDGEDSHG